MELKSGVTKAQTAPIVKPEMDDIIYANGLRRYPANCPSGYTPRGYVMSEDRGNGQVTINHETQNGGSTEVIDQNLLRLHPICPVF